MALAGGTLAARAASGADDIAAVRRTALRLMGKTTTVDPVDDMGDESFPASDAPSWSSGSAVGRSPDLEPPVIPQIRSGSGLDPI